MTAISRFIEGGPVVLLAYVSITKNTREAIVFEVLEVNAPSLHLFIGVKQFLTCDGDEPFWGELVELTPCTPTANGLRLLADRAALRGAIKIYPGKSSTLQ